MAIDTREGKKSSSYHLEKGEREERRLAASAPRKKALYSYLKEGERCRASEKIREGMVPPLSGKRGGGKRYVS